LQTGLTTFACTPAYPKIVAPCGRGQAPSLQEVSFQEFEKFGLLVKSAPILGTTKPVAIDLATWRCDGLEFNLVTHKRYVL
jgi:hypothetical protein